MLACRSSWMKLLPTKASQGVLGTVLAGVRYRCVMSGTAGEPHELYTVGHDRTNSEFYIDLQWTESDGSGEGVRECRDRAILQYAWEQKNVVDLYHTHVPETMRGKGLAKLLAKAAMDFIVEEDVKMALTCTYLQKYLRENPLQQYTNRVVR